MELIAPNPDEQLKSLLRDLFNNTKQKFKNVHIDVQTKLKLLREQLQKNTLNGFLVPRADEHQGEYVSLKAQRLAWITGFTGSAGLAIILDKKAALIVDGRYILQAKDQVDQTLFTIIELSAQKTFHQQAEEWIKNNMHAGQKLGLDPWLHTYNSVTWWQSLSKKYNFDLKLCTKNLVDQVWDDQPAEPITPIWPHASTYAGQESKEKCEKIAIQLKEQHIKASIIADPTSIAWILNVRGGDIPHTPVVLSFAIIYDDATVQWFVDKRKFTSKLYAHLGTNITIEKPEKLKEVLEKLGFNKSTVHIDEVYGAYWFYDILQKTGTKIILSQDFCALPKACKNPIEIQGMKNAHIRDGAALVKFLAWLQKEIKNSLSKKELVLTEMDCAEKLFQFRKENDLFCGLSFDTISGAGSNSAVVHYRVTKETNQTLNYKELYLVDSGGQYFDGTTDVTRTIAIGNPTQEMKDRFTRVLKGHVAVACAKFPIGTTGQHLDSLARYWLWQIGLDYNHGTGHGVGAYLSVHEGPQRIHKSSSLFPLLPGMVVSNEPGYYKENAYGIRIENLVTVIPIEEAGFEIPMLGFKTLTYAPYDCNLIDTSILSRFEIDWINQYHQEVYAILSPLVDQETEEWLKEATKPLK
ncbi:MAG: aminopeptidase P family protein [Alphaproteobacteria bacterium]|nr:aminopeptidase P family protein [Alphaproteobacteria bacterium]